MTVTIIKTCGSIEEIGVRRNLLEDLALKTLYLVGEMSVHELSRHMRLRPGMGGGALTTRS